MATNRHAMIRYKALDKCFSNFYRKYAIEDLIEFCNEEVYAFDGTEGISRRTIFNDINYMRSEQGWGAPIEKYYDGKKPYYRYSDHEFSISKMPLSEKEVIQLRETVNLLGRFSGMPWIEEFCSALVDKFKLKGNTRNIIGLDQNRYLKGVEFLPELFNYIMNMQVLNIRYETFKKGILEFIVHPYYMKQYNNRWFLLGLNDEYRNITTVALDRIVSVEAVSVEYRYDPELDFEEYFDDVVGVTVPKNTSPQAVRLRFSENRFPYVTSKPLHPSQRIVDAEKCVIELSVIPNMELETLILSFGSDVEVLDNEPLRQRVSHTIQEMHKKYFGAQNDCTE